MSPAAQRPVSWVVLANHRVRAATFAAIFLVIASHLYERPQGGLVWALLTLHLWVYPHLLYAFANRSDKPLKVEYLALLLEPALMGAWAAWLGFPLWIAFPVFLGSLISISLYQGPRGTAGAALSFGAGALTVIALHGFTFAPDTRLLTSALAMSSLGIYLLLVAEAARQRGLKLRHAREALREKEQALQRQLQANQSLQQQLLEQANRDALTGLFNRRYLDATILRELARSQRESQPLSLLIMDIDHFKQVNDRHGHQAGDEVLRQVAQALAAGARQSDVVCRYGGEEYLVLLPNVTCHTAQVRAEAYRAAVQALPIPFGPEILHVTISIGVATFPQHGQTAQALIQQADAALYQAKQLGRNRVVVAQNQAGGLR